MEGKNKRAHESDELMGPEPLLKRNHTSNEVFDENNICKISVSGKYVEQFGSFALCSLEDFDKLKKQKWSWYPNGYAMACIYNKGVRSNVTMSRYILEPPNGFYVDHINRVRGDNRRENLRLATPCQNAQNITKRQNSSSLFYGVHFDKPKNLFRSRITINGKRFSLGFYDTDVEAAEMFDRFVIQNREKYDLYHPINFPEKEDHYRLLPILYTKTKSSNSLFKNVIKQKKRFRGKFYHNKKLFDLGLFDTAEDAAKAVDKCVVGNKINKKLNFPEDYPNYTPYYEQKSFIIEIDFDIKDIQNILKDLKSHGELPDINPETDVFVKLYSSKGEIFTIIERVDFEIVKYNNLNMDNHGYVKISFSKKSAFLSRFLFKDSIGENHVVDHVNSNTLDNRRRFLKILYSEDNSKNRKKQTGKTTSKYIGVSKSDRYWQVSVSNNKKNVFRKYVNDELHGARLRDLFLICHYPQKYRLNFSDWDEKTKLEWQFKLRNYINWI